MRSTHITNEEKTSSGGFTVRVDFSYRDIATGIANNTAATYGAGYLPALRASDIVKRVLLHITTPFQNTADAAFNTTTISVGDTTTATRFVNASESNLNGTEVLNVFPGAVENVIYTTTAQLQLTINSMAAKSISNLNAGQGYILFAIDRAADPAREKAPPFIGSGQ